jgi:aryl-alcohol dehydrogenase-like predicted oxidoreductase
MSVVPWSPLASGLLTGKHGREELAPHKAALGSRAAIANEVGPFPDRTFAMIEAVRRVADAR